MRKVDVDLALEEGASTTLPELKAGSTVMLRADEDSGMLECCTSEGVLLGRVPEPQARQLGPDPSSYKVSLRSLKRSADGSVSGIQIRIVTGDTGVGRAVEPLTPGTGLEPADDPSGYVVTAQQLLRLAHNPEVVVTLKDEALQQQLLKIDGAQNREQALQLALQDERFRQFADKVVGIIKPS